MDKVNLLRLPTPLHEIKVDDKNKYFIKRDDLTDFGLGGNKARKMEFFLKDIMNKGCDYVVTYGSVESNHCRITSMASARIGMKQLLILAGSKEDFTYSGNDLIYCLTGANIKFCGVNEVSYTIEYEIEKLKKKGYNPYFIPGGGHGSCGTHAYVQAYEEIKQQSAEIGVDFDYIFIASGTGTTQAGLIAGKEILSGNENIVGISISRRAKRGFEIIRESIEAYYRELNIKALVQEGDIILNDLYIGAGYGDVYKEVVCSIREMLNRNSIILDPIYTGKAFYGMCQFIKENNIENKNVLFIHTGGTPIFFKNGRKIVDLLDGF